MSYAAVVARGVAARYGGRNGRGALSNLDLDVAAGEVVAVLGPNGAGKSTLLRLLATAVPASAGALALLGHDARRPTPVLRRRLGIVPETAAHLEALTGRENAVAFARAAGLAPAAAARAADALLDRLGLAPDADRPVAEYSLGMRQKLVLVQALGHQPALLVLDEPTLGLDAPSRERLREILRERAAEGTAVVLATHDLAEAEVCCTRVVFLHRGRKVLEGTPAQLIASCGGATRITIALRAACAPDVRVEGAEIALATAEHLVVHTARGLAVLPELCAGVLSAGSAIESLEVRQSDLGDVFLRATGAELVTS